MSGHITTTTLQVQTSKNTFHNQIFYPIIITAANISWIYLAQQHQFTT